MLPKLNKIRFLPGVPARTAVMYVLSVLAAPVAAELITPPAQVDLDRALQESTKPVSVIPTPRGLANAPRGGQRDGQRSFEADHAEGTVDAKLSAHGNVILRQGNMTVRTETVEYDQLSDTVTSLATVQLSRDADVLTGRNLLLKLDTEVGSLQAATFLFGRTPLRPNQRYNARGGADTMQFEGPDHERLFNATYSTCRADQQDWVLRVSELALDRTEDVGTGFHGRVEFMGLPILYTPYMTFPLNGERKSGFLPPTPGTSVSGGLELAVPWYWNIAPNQDATITPKFFGRRGVQLGAEYRYLNKNSLGQLDAEYMDYDRVAGRSRYLFAARHFQNLSAWLPVGWSASVNAQKVSDDAYFRDLSTRLASTSQTNLPRDVAINYASDFGSFSAHNLSFQTLQDPLAPVGIPYRLAPQITFNSRPARIRGFEFNTTGDYSDFRQPTLVNGRRWMLYPSVAWPLIKPFGFITPKLGYHLTHYTLTKNEKGYSGGSRELPIASLDSGLAFERPLSWGNTAVTQTLEPRLFFLYVPYREQSTLPVFSTSSGDFNFAQIFNENQFIGGDRIADAKQLTAAVTTRFIENLTGIERIRASIGQRYYYRTQQVTLPADSSSNAALGISGTTASRSDLLLGVSGQVSDALVLDSTFQYSSSLKKFQAANFSTRYTDPQYRIFNFGYRFTRSAIKQIDVSTQWPFGKAAPGWTLLARANHSLADRRLLEGLVGVEYNQGCWELRLVAHRFATATQQYSTSLQFQLELKGLSKLGVNPLETLRQNIVGYKRSDDRGESNAP